MIIKNGTIYDAVNKDGYVADILVKDGKIAEIRKNIDAENEEIINAEGLNIYPGLIDAHSHIGLSSYAGGDTDVNEKNDIISPHLRAIDGFNPFSKYLKKALSGGVTTVGAGPGSASIISGTFLALKLYGTCVDDMCLKNNVAMKCALGENPKNTFGTKCDSTRITTAAKLREFLFGTKIYMEKKKQANEETRKTIFDMKYEAMIPVMEGKMPLKIHVHRADDICTAIRIAKEFNLKATLEHCTEGHLVADKIAQSGFPCAVGPSMSGISKNELENKTFETAGILSKAGVTVSIITDAPVTQQEYLGPAAGFAVKYGMDRFEALKAITINPAKHLGIEDRVGSLEVGKDADIIIADGDIMLNTTTVLKVIIDGKVVVGE